MFDTLIEGLEIQKIFFPKTYGYQITVTEKSVYKSLSALLLGKVKYQTLS